MKGLFRAVRGLSGAVSGAVSGGCNGGCENVRCVGRVPLSGHSELPTFVTCQGAQTPWSCTVAGKFKALSAWI